MPKTTDINPKALLQYLQREDSGLLIHYINLLILFDAKYETTLVETHEKSTKKQKASIRKLKYEMMHEFFRQYLGPFIKINGPSFILRGGLIVSKGSFFEMLVKASRAFKPLLPILFIEACRTHSRTGQRYVSIIASPGDAIKRGEYDVIYAALERKYARELDYLKEEKERHDSNSYSNRLSFILGGVGTGLLFAFLIIPYLRDFSPAAYFLRFMGLSAEGVPDAELKELDKYFAGSRRELLVRVIMNIGISALILYYLSIMRQNQRAKSEAGKQFFQIINELEFREPTSVHVREKRIKEHFEPLSASFTALSPAAENDEEALEFEVIIPSMTAEDRAYLNKERAEARDKRRAEYHARILEHAESAKNDIAPAAAYVTGLSCQFADTDTSSLPTLDGKSYLAFPFSTNHADASDLISYLIIPKEIWNMMEINTQRQLLSLIQAGARKSEDCQLETIDGTRFYSLKFRGHVGGSGGRRIYFDCAQPVKVEAVEKSMPGYIATAFGDYLKGSGKIASVPGAKIPEGVASYA